MQVSEVIQSSRRVLVPSPTQASHLQLHLCPLLPHTGISRCILLFQRMTINAQSTPGVRSPGAHPPLCSFTLPQTLKSLGPSGRNDRFEVPNHLACLGHILPHTPSDSWGGWAGKGILTELSPTTPGPFPLSHFPLSLTLHSISLLTS